MNIPDTHSDIPSRGQRLHVSQRHIRHLVRDDRIPYLRWVRLVRFDPRRIDAWLAANTHNHTVSDQRPGDATGRRP